MLRAIDQVNTIYDLASGLNSVRHDGLVLFVSRLFQNYFLCYALGPFVWYIVPHIGFQINKISLIRIVCVLLDQRKQYARKCWNFTILSVRLVLRYRSCGSQTTWSYDMHAYETCEWICTNTNKRYEKMEMPLHDFKIPENDEIYILLSPFNDAVSIQPLVSQTILHIFSHHHRCHHFMSTMAAAAAAIPSIPTRELNDMRWMFDRLFAYCVLSFSELYLFFFCLIRESIASQHCNSHCGWEVFAVYGSFFREKNMISHHNNTKKRYITWEEREKEEQLISLSNNQTTPNQKKSNEKCLICLHAFVAVFLSTIFRWLQDQTTVYNRWRLVFIITGLNALVWRNAECQ